MSVLHCARDVVIENLAKQPETASEDKAGDRSYIWEARRHYMRPSDKHELEVVNRIVRYSSGPQGVSE
jgi:hypothetical protein